MKAEITAELFKRAAVLDSKAFALQNNSTADIDLTPQHDSPLFRAPRILADFPDWCVVYKPPYMNVTVDGDLSSTREEDPEIDEPERNGLASFKEFVSSKINLPISSDRVHAFGILHRLDTLTSGPLLVAKNYRGFYDLRTQFATGMVKKEYVCLSRGSLNDQTLRISERLRLSTVFDPNGKPIATKTAVDNQRGKPALTEVELIAPYREHDEDHQKNEVAGPLAYLNVKLYTGRTHQIRAHLSHVGLPLIGDAKYGERSTLTPRTFLHSKRLGFVLDGKEVFVDCPLPSDLQEVLDGLVIA